MKKKQINALILLAMKITILPICVTLVFTCATFARDAKGQAILKKNIALNFENTELKKVVGLIQEKTGVPFIYSSKVIGADRKITFNGASKNIGQFMTEVLAPLNIAYKIEDEKVLLYRLNIGMNQIMVLNAQFDNKSIKGTVKSDKGNPLSGATVQIVNTKYAIITDASGNYEFRNIPPGSYTVSFMFVGFLQKSIKVELNDDAIVNSELVEDVLKLQDVIVTGGGNPKKKIESSVAITTMSSREMQQRAPVSSADMLKAIPGLNVESTGGEGPGNVFVRGFPQQGGYIFLGIQEDGIPVLPTGFNTSPSADQYFKADLTIKTVEAIRGGNAPIVQANSPGAVVNNISYTGADRQYGQVKFTTGLSQGLYRGDFNTGGKLNNRIMYNIGGFYRTDNGSIPPGFKANEGGQLKGNMTYNFKNDKGFIRFYGKYLNDKVQFMLPSYYSYDGSGKPNPIPGFDLTTESLVSKDTKFDYTYPTGSVRSYDQADGIHTRLGYGGLQLNYKVGGWRLNNSFRYQYNDVNSTYGATAGLFAYDTSKKYYTLSGSAVSFNRGDQYVGINVSGRTSVDKQIVDYLDIKRKLDNHFVSFGVGIYQYNTNDTTRQFRQYTVLTKQPSRLLIGTNTGNGTSFLQIATRIGNTRTLSAYGADEITLSNDLRLDFGVRVDNQHVNGKRPYYALKADGAPDYTKAATTAITGFTDYNETVTNWAASIGMNYKINSTTAMFARITRAYNAPTVSDYNATAYNPDNIKVRPVYLGEVGVKYAKNSLAVFASGSYSAIKNVSLSITVPTSSGNQTLVAFGSTRTYSAEFEASYRIAKSLSFRFTGTLQDSRYTDYTAHTNVNSAIVALLGDTTYSFTGKRTERVPSFNMELSATYDYKGLNLYLAGSFIGDRYTAPSDSYRLPAYGLMRGGLGYSFTKNVSARFWADNLLNAKVLTEGDVRGDQFRDFSKVAVGTYMPGRTLLPQTFWASLSYSF